MLEKIKISAFEWILIGSVIHSLGSFFFGSSRMLCYVLCGAGLAIILYNAIFRLKYRNELKGFSLVLFYIYLLWSVFIAIRPFVNSEKFTTDGYSMINIYTWLSLTTPLIMLLGFRNISLKSIFKYSLLQGIIGVVLLIINSKKIFGVDQNFSADGEDYQKYIALLGLPLQFLSASSFMLLCNKFLPSKGKVLSFLMILLAVFTSLFTARRGNAFMYGLILVFSLLIYVLASQKGSAVKNFIIVTGLVALGFIFFNSFGQSTFSLLMTRLDEDTRAGVEDQMIYSFKNTPLDWIIGRGIDGNYFCAPCGMTAMRGEIETGYLQLILKGGIVYLVMFVGFLLISAFKGLFQTNNTMSKAMALYLIAHIIFLLPFGLPAFNFEYLVVWICVLYCQSKEFRRLSDNQVMNMIYLYK